MVDLAIPQRLHLAECPNGKVTVDLAMFLVVRKLRLMFDARALGVAVVTKLQGIDGQR